jgi:hypothetical protein
MSELVQIIPNISFIYPDRFSKKKGKQEPAGKIR